MTSPTTRDSGDDLSALAWVHDELRRSLEAAHKSLRRFVREAEAVGVSDLDAVDPSVLRSARAQIHQGVGALELVGLPAAATLLRASEALVQRVAAKPRRLNAEVIEAIERASFGLLDYLGRLLANKPVSPLALFPQYRAVQEAAGADRVHPADLWSVDWQWREVPADPSALPRQPDAATRGALEAQLLTLMKTASPTLPAEQMSDICAQLGNGAVDPRIATFWRLAAAVFEAQSQGLLGFDVFSKRVASRLLVQFRALERDDVEVSERLAHDLLFFCAQSESPGDGHSAPRLAAVRQAYGLAHHLPVDYATSPLGRFDPTWQVQARKRVVAAKEAWSAVAAGEMHRLAGLSEQFALVGDSLKRLFPLGDLFAGELQHAVHQTQQAGTPPPAPLAMEVATSLLYIEAVLEDADFGHPEQAGRVRRLADRLASVRHGHPPDPLEAWMEELYRRVSDRQTMGSVVQELRASLSDAEKSIDAFFRNPADAEVLAAVPNQLTSMRGVLSVLGMDHAAAALLRMREEVDGLIETEIEPQHVAAAGVFDRLAGNLGALGFLIDMLSVQPQMVKSLFRYDADDGTLSPVMGREAPAAASAPAVELRLIEQAQSLAFSSVRQDVPVAAVERDLDLLARDALAADQTALALTVQKARDAIDGAADADALATARGELSEALVDFVASANDPVGLDFPLVRPSVRQSLSTGFGAPPAPVVDAGLGDDAEMREVFLEEAREVLVDATAARDELESAPDDLALLTTLRRAFHTLKGSGRMVGLTAFGEAAWVCEQLYNTHLAEQKAAGPALIDFTGWSLAYLTGWVEAIAAGRSGEHDAATVQRAAEALASGGMAAFPELDLLDGESAVLARATAPAPAAPAAAAAAAEPEADEPFVIDFDLDSLDTPFAAREGVISSPMTLDFSIADDANAPFGVPTSTGSEAPALPETHEIQMPSDLGFFDAAPHAAPPAAAANEAATLGAAPAELEAEEPVRVVGPLRIGIPLFNIYLNEADELSRRLSVEIAEWALELHRPIGETPIALAHSLAGSSATVGFADLSQLARLLEHAQARSQAIGRGTEEEGLLFGDAADEIRRLLHQFAAGFLKEPSQALMARLADHERTSALRLEAATAAADVPATSVPGELVEPVFELAWPDDDEAASAAARPEAVDVAETAGIRETPEVAETPLVPETPELARTPEATSPTAVALAEPAPAPEPKLEPVPAPVSASAAAAAAEAASDLPGAAALDRSLATPAEPDDIPPRVADELDLPDGTPLAAFGRTDLKPFAERPPEPPRPVVAAPALVLRDDDEPIDAVDAVDEELFPIFTEEAEELLPQLGSRLRDWTRRPGDAALPSACMRTLHTLKGGARLAGAMRLGEMAHRLETRIERLVASPPLEARAVEALQHDGDALLRVFEALRDGGDGELDASWSAPVDAQVAEALQPVLDVPSTAGGPAPASPAAAAPAPAPDDASPIDWRRFDAAEQSRRPVERPQSAQSSVRVRAPVLDRLVNHAGEVSITRSRIEAGVAQMKSSLGDLTDNLDRLRAQLRDIEFHSEVQMSSRMEAAKAASQAFDPLEFDRFTRFQELTRMMAESVNDVATVQRSVQRAIETAEDELVAQARLTRDLQAELLRTRMVEFEGLSDRLYRVVRQAAKETAKSVRLDIVGGGVEVDRGVLDRMTGAFEHLLRNCVAHGIEAPAQRTAAGKDPTGSVTVALSHEGNEVGVEFRDDGAGLDLPRIRERAIALGLLDPGAASSEAELANMIFLPGFTTAVGVTELAGRGVGMDVVRSEVNAMGGRIETATTAGQGTSFKLVLPLTTAVTQVVLLRCGETRIAVPSTLVEAVQRATPAEVDAAYASGRFTLGGVTRGAHAASDDTPLPFFWLGALLQTSARPVETAGKTRMVVAIRSAHQRIAIHVDEVLGNHEVVVKNLGPQLSRMPGLAGVTLLASGGVALIYNPVALATLYGAAAQAATRASLRPGDDDGGGFGAAPSETEPREPLVLVVDDSLTVRRVTQRLLLREGYRVVLAKDGLDALERLAEEVPQIVLSDIEMPRMDGFDLVRNIRADARLRELPVIMITSRIAQKHRDVAAELGVDHYLGKPYAEEDLLSLVGRYTSHRVAA